jgi:hypothetical protein
MNSLKKTARGAGILYILMDVFMLFSGMVVDPKIYVPGDAVATSSNILAFEWLFRLGFVSWIIGYTRCCRCAFMYSQYAQSVRSHPALKRCRTSLSFHSGSVTNTINGILGYISTWDYGSRVFVGSLAHSPRTACLQVEICP